MINQLEMNIWWTRHDSHFEHLSESDKLLIEDLTGRIPLLLGPFLYHGAGLTNLLNHSIWEDDTLASVSRNVRDFADAKRCEADFKT